MTEAIFGLLGVVVGAVITGGFEVWREARQRRREIRAAVRVGYIGGVYAAEAVTEALHTKKWPPSIPFDRTHLAPHLERIAALGDELRSKPCSPSTQLSQ